MAFHFRVSKSYSCNDIACYHFLLHAIVAIWHISSHFPASCFNILICPEMYAKGAMILHD